MLVVTYVNIVLFMLLKSDPHFLIEIIPNLSENIILIQKVNFWIQYPHSFMHRTHVRKYLAKVFYYKFPYVHATFEVAEKFSCEPCSYDGPLHFPTAINHVLSRTYSSNTTSHLGKDSDDSGYTCWTARIR